MSGKKCSFLLIRGPCLQSRKELSTALRERICVLEPDSYESEIHICCGVSIKSWRKDLADKFWFYDGYYNMRRTPMALTSQNLKQIIASTELNIYISSQY